MFKFYAALKQRKLENKQFDRQVANEIEKNKKLAAEIDQRAAAIRKHVENRMNIYSK